MAFWTSTILRRCRTAELAQPFKSVSAMEFFSQPASVRCTDYFNNMPFESRRVFVKFSLEFFLGAFIHSCAIHANLLPGNHACLIRYIKTPTLPWLGFIFVQERRCQRSSSTALSTSGHFFYSSRNSPCIFSLHKFLRFPSSNAVFSPSKKKVPQE